MGFWLTIISFGIFQGVFIFIYFLISNRIEKIRRIITLLLIASLLLLCTDFVLSNYFILYTQKAFVGIGWGSSFWLLIVPLYYLLFCSFLTGTTLDIKKEFLHFTPFLASMVINLPFFILPPETRQEYLLSYSSGQNITALHIILKTAYHLQLLVYPLLIFFLIRRKGVSTFNFVSVVNGCLLTLGIVSFIHLLSFNVLGLSISWFTSTFVFVSLTLFIHATAYILMFRPNWMFRHIKEVISKYTNSNLTNVDLIKIQDDLNHLMIQQKIYLQQDLNLSKLAQHLSITPHQLSEFLNHKNSETFHDYINLHRVNEAKDVLSNTKNNVFTIEAIAQQVGFNSTATFYRSFKKHTGFSPTKWLESRVE